MKDAEVMPMTCDCPEMLDNSGASCYDRCPRKYFFERICGYTNAKSTIHFDYGSSMHVAFPLAFYGEDSWEPAHEAFCREWEFYGHGEADSKRNTITAMESLKLWARMHKPGTCMYRLIRPPASMRPPSERISDMEWPFLVDIGAPIPFAGRLDGIAEMVADGKRCGVDFKTSSEISPRLFKCLKFGSATVGYSVGASHQIGERCFGMIFDFSRVSAKNVECQATPVHVSDEQVRAWKVWYSNVCLELIRSCQGGVWIKKPTGCSPYGQFGFPSFYCPYEDLCDLPDHVWMDGLKFYKQTTPYQPFHLRGEPIVLDMHESDDLIVEI